MTNEQRAEELVREWAQQFEAQANGGAGAFGELTRRIARAMAEASEASDDGKLLTFLIAESNFGNDWLGDSAWDECELAAADESDNHEPEDYQYWMRKAIRRAMEDKAK